MVVSNTLYTVHCVKETLVHGEDGGDPRNPSNYSTEYAGNNTPNTLGHSKDFKTAWNPAQQG